MSGISTKFARERKSEHKKRNIWRLRHFDFCRWPKTFIRWLGGNDGWTL